MKNIFTILLVISSISSYAQNSFDKQWSIHFNVTDQFAFGHSEYFYLREDEKLYFINQNKIQYTYLPEISPVDVLSIGTPESISIYAFDFDSQNNIYLMCSTTDMNNISTPNVYKNSIDLDIVAEFGQNFFLAKFDPSGTLQALTYINNLEDGGFSKRILTLDNADNVYFTEYIPYTEVIPNAPFQSTATIEDILMGNRCSSIVKLNSDLQLVWRTFFSHNSTFLSSIYAMGDQLVVSGGVVADLNSTTYNPNYFWANGGFLQNNQQPGPRMFVNVLNSNGTRAWGTYLNNTNSFSILNLKISGNEIYVLHQATLEPTENAFFQSPEVNMITKINSTGGRIWSNYTKATDIDIDGNNNLLLLGTTYTEIAVTPDAYQSTINSNSAQNSTSDAFHQILSSDGSQLLYGSYFGDYGDDTSFKFFHKSNGELLTMEYIKNYQNENDFITQGNPLNFHNNLGYNGIVISLFSKATASNTKQELENLSVYPNPVEDQLIIENEFAFKDSDQVKVYTLLGQELKIDKQIDNQYIYINTTSWSSGMYLIEVLVDGKKGSYKVIKK